MSSVCIQLIVVAVTLSLSDVACQTVHNISISDDVHSGRQRRQAQPLTQEQTSEIVDRHNNLRGLEGAADMELMVWNASLALLAATWATTCRTDHTPGRHYGQNIAGTTANKINLISLVDMWYNEKPYYKGVELACDKGKDCEHYTQMVCADTRSIGCALHRCSPWTYLYCNYWLKGNINGVTFEGKRYPAIVYKRGPACSKCSNGAGWCKNKLCNRNCSSAGEVVRAPQSATTALRWTSKLVGVSVLRDGMARTVQCVVLTHTKSATATPIGLRASVIFTQWFGVIVLLCAVCVKETQTQKKVSVLRCVDPPQTLTMPQHRRCSS